MMQNLSSSNKPLYLLLFSILLCGVLGFALGYFVHEAVNLNTNIGFERIKEVLNPTPMVLLGNVPQVDTEALLRIHSKEDVEETRKKLLKEIFGKEELPSWQPSVDMNIVLGTNALTDYQADRLNINLPHNIKTYFYLVHPPNRYQKRMMIYHAGHGGFSEESDFPNVRTFLEHGFDVMLGYMPLEIKFDDMYFYSECCGPIRLLSHEQFIWLENPMSFFLEPVAVSLNVAEQYGYKAYYMTGISGGGWTTTVYAAIDPRIKRSFPVAGSLPLWMRRDSLELGDFEQIYLPLYSIANYEELYLLGGYGEGRSQLQILNEVDPCCFQGDGRHSLYEGVIQKRLKKLGGGNFNVLVDKGHNQHNISPKMVQVMIMFINQMDS